MTAGTVVITGGILATVILLCIIAVLCYCRLQKFIKKYSLKKLPHEYYCCKKEDSEEDEEEPDFAVHSRFPPVHCNRNVVLANGPSIYASPYNKKHQHCRSVCQGCSHNEPPAFLLHPPDEIRNGGERITYKTISQEEIELPVNLSNLQVLNPNRLSAMREAFSRSRSISTDV